MNRRPLRPVPHRRVRIQDAFWSPRLERLRTRTLDHLHDQLHATGRLAAIRGEWKEGMPGRPHPFWDSDVAKWMEAAALVLATDPSEPLRRRLEGLIDDLARAQQPDGYIHAYHCLVEPGRQWTNLRDRHELYCGGHLIEAAVAHFEATGSRKFVEVMIRYADLLCRTFGRGEGRRRGYCGHPEIELALVRLYRVTGDSRYLHLSRYFLQERGQAPHYFDLEARERGEDPADYRPGTHAYTQSHKPLPEQAEAVGHAVRALYLYAGWTDVAAELGAEGDAETSSRWLEIAEQWWQSIYRRKLYLTGGIGSSRLHEGFTADYHLPNDTAYAETCAAVASFLWNWRLLQVRMEGRFADEMERALYNGILSGISLDGTRFFYANPLAMDPEAVGGSDPYVKSERAPWFDCACCPTNLARLLAGLGGYACSEWEGGAAVHLFLQGTTEFRLGDRIVQLEQQHQYPWKGRLAFRLHMEGSLEFELRIRFPGWCREGGLLLNGAHQPAHLEEGYLVLKREWQPGDELQLHLAMPVERMHAHPAVLENAGRMALQRGPLVYCLEEHDCECSPFHLMLPVQADLLPIHERGLLGGITTLQGEALRLETGDWHGRLYRPGRSQGIPARFKAIPYFAWANRGPARMAVWIREC